MSLSCRQEHQLPPRQSWRAPVRPSSRRDVRRVRQAACGRRHARLRAGGPGARQPQPPPASPAWNMAARIAVAAAIRVLLSKAVAWATAPRTSFRHASRRGCEALAASRSSATAAPRLMRIG